MTAASALIALAGCADPGATVRGVHLIQAGKITTCTHLPYPPFQSESKDVPDEVIGFDVAVIDLVARELGVKQQVIDTQFETIKTGADLNARQCDVAAAGMTITKERLASMDFSAPYFNATQALMARKGSGIRSLEDVRAGRARLGAQAGTTGESYVQEKGLEARSYDNTQSQLDSLKINETQVVVQDYPVVSDWLKKPENANLELVGKIDTGEQYGFAVRKDGNPELVRLIDTALRRAVADGTYRRLYEQWIGPMPAEALKDVGRPTQ